MKNLKSTLVTIVLSSTFVVAGFLTSPAGAVALTTSGGANAAKGAEQPTNLFGMGGMFSTVSNILLFIIGAVAVIMIIIGGLRYVTSGGDSANITAAKNTILYALVGVIIAILAYSVINFVISSFTGGGGMGIGGGGMTNV